VSELFAKRKEIKQEAVGFTGDIDLDIPTDKDEVRANHEAAEKQFAEQMGESAKKIIARQAQSSDPETLEGSQFLKDLPRGTDLVVNGKKVPVKDANGNSVSASNDKVAQRALHQQADDIIRDFLSGDDPTFARPLSELTNEQKQQIRILEALCTQYTPDKAETANIMSILGPGYEFGGASHSPKNTFKYVMNKDTEGNIVVTLTATFYLGSLIKLNNGELIYLDAFNSTSKVTASVAISPDELGRLSGLTWNVPDDQLTDEHRPQFAKKSINGTINLKKGAVHISGFQ
jgi:hypothetical protein